MEGAASDAAAEDAMEAVEEASGLEVAGSITVQMCAWSRHVGAK